MDSNPAGGEREVELHVQYMVVNCRHLIDGDKHLLAAAAGSHHVVGGTFGSRFVVEDAGGHLLVVDAGSHLLMVDAGSHLLVVAAGSHLLVVAAGSHLPMMAVGRHLLGVTAGRYSVVVNHYLPAVLVKNVGMLPRTVSPFLA